MSEANGGWAALFSGGKESSWALYQALESGRDVRTLVVVQPPETSSMYHAPAQSIIRLAARSIGLPLLDVGLPVTDMEPPDLRTSVSEGQADELEALEPALERLDTEFDGGLCGLVAGTVTSDYQADRLQSMCDRLDCAFFAPLWQMDPRELAETMIDGGLTIHIVEVAGPGFDESWLGRQLDHDALAELEALHREYGVHLLGEGGEFQTIVTDGPHMSRPIAFEFEREWDGTWGQIRITDAKLEAPTSADEHR
ncbi:diphthine--ammonia ligase [Natrinema hispanicum]|uniref:Metal-binding-domain/4Fe-4S-binding-domain containing ABC transporter, ATP-binding protein n=1 Tax=Natrinema hispanicum TaxID=392421 RepID=A0A1G6VXW9_9EURY|nr:diphthine--ammonia ligase [Natrinema hispanicum]SDD58273.1 metal-binding-domain/4Fe-4S-binding-domain containing ABC transporter, ATP-binding protein [Natrinema hispanicum]SET95516.1 metal-binding-domain/4Fe-4S-binding-domain containing ABC transporter, ATP-binding protein [Natrinema hispanicum]